MFWNSPNQKLTFSFFSSIFCCAISFPRHCWMSKACLGRERGVEGFAEHESLGYNLEIFFYCIAVNISILHTVSTSWELSWRLICFNVGAFENDSVLTCCWQSQKKLRSGEGEAKKKIRYNSWSIRCWFSVDAKCSSGRIWLSVSRGYAAFLDLFSYLLVHSPSLDAWPP